MLGALSSSFPRPTRPSSLVSSRSSRAKVSHANHDQHADARSKLGRQTVEGPGILADVLWGGA